MVSDMKSGVICRSETVKYDVSRSVSHYESVGRGFESLPVYQKMQIPIRVSAFFIALKGTRTIKCNRVYFVKEGFTPSQNTHDCGSFVAK